MLVTTGEAQVTKENTKEVPSAGVQRQKKDQEVRKVRLKRSMFLVKKC